MNLSSTTSSFFFLVSFIVSERFAILILLKLRLIPRLLFVDGFSSSSSFYFSSIVKNWFLLWMVGSFVVLARLESCSELLLNRCGRVVLILLPSRPRSTSVLDSNSFSEDWTSLDSFSMSEDWFAFRERM